MIAGWSYYNHAAIPNCAPHEIPDLNPIYSGKIWKIEDGGGCFLARWTTDWDCGYETGFWYVIKDSPYNIESLKAKRRYEITKGRRYYSVKIINPAEFQEDLFHVTTKAYEGWPKKYRPIVNKDSFCKTLEQWIGCDFFGAFNKSTGNLVAYAVLKDLSNCILFSVLRADPSEEKNGINAAMVDGILQYYNDRFTGDFYICDGARSIRHETAFQDYLEKYFGFRKVYCKLNIKYRGFFGLLIKALFPFRKVIKAKTSFGSKIKPILLMEEIRRDNEK